MTPEEQLANDAEFALLTAEVARLERHAARLQRWQACYEASLKPGTLTTEIDALLDSCHRLSEIYDQEPNAELEHDLEQDLARLEATLHDSNRRPGVLPFDFEAYDGESELVLPTAQSRRANPHYGERQAGRRDCLDTIKDALDLYALDNKDHLREHRKPREVFAMLRAKHDDARALVDALDSRDPVTALRDEPGVESVVEGFEALAIHWLGSRFTPHNDLADSSGAMGL